MTPRKKAGIRKRRAKTAVSGKVPRTRRPKTELPARAGQFYSRESIGRTVEKFVDILQTAGITWSEDGSFARVIQNTKDYAARTSSTDASNVGKQKRKRFGDAIALSEMAAAVLQYRKKKRIFRELVKHLQCWANTEEPAITSTAKATDRGANSIVELLVAAHAADLGSDLKLEDPFRAGKKRGENPDVLVTIDGRRWAFACKMAQKTDRKNWAANIWKLIVDGVDQIEKSNADVGVVVIGVRNILDYDAIWTPDDIASSKERKQYKSAANGVVTLRNQIKSLERATKAYAKTELGRLFRGVKKSLRGVLFVAHAVTQSADPEHPDDATLHTMMYSPMTRKPDTRDFRVLARLNERFQTTLPK
jgi:hypothetical protein